MISTFLDLYFKLGQILCYTPSYTKPKTTFLQILYSFILSTFLTVALGITISNRNFYGDYNYIKTAVSALLDFTLLTFNYSIILVVLCKEQQWKLLTGSIRTITTKYNKGRKYRYLIFVFVVAHCTGWLVIALSFKAFLEFYGMWYFKNYNIQYLQLGLLFSYNMFLCLIVALIWFMYKEVKVSLRKTLSDDVAKNVLYVVTNLDDSLCFLKDTVDVFNEIFAWPITLLIFHTNLQIINDSNSISVVKEELYEFTNSVIDNFPKFSVARFFEIRRSNLLNILGTVATFLIIMIQFHGKHDE
ncbi:hypothetical protein Zmor_018232 [Zophobas morio]|uniref:Gustatory receptor n=1 Tax=Zophobas morio TaxID=2755281 RepID=A0AA38MDM1_9CUCU|nr:hypothetical protein Zmor_018232 [Zophobas morio]